MLSGRATSPFVVDFERSPPTETRLLRRSVLAVAGSAWTISERTPHAQQLLHDAYVSKANAVAAEVDKALKANGLE
jgi:hypothetical protein